MKKVLAYIISYVMMLGVGVMLSLAAICLAILILMFVTWTLPPFGAIDWIALTRLCMIPGFMLATAWIFSKENKEFIKDLLDATAR